MRGERVPGNPINAILEFARTDSSQGVNNFTLKGPINVPTNFYAFTICVPTPNVNIGTFGIVVISGSLEPEGYYKKILDLKLPPRIAASPIKDNVVLRQRSEQVSLATGRPALMISFGEAQATREEVTMLWSVHGVSPSTALSELKEGARKRLEGLKARES